MMVKTLGISFVLSAAAFGAVAQSAPILVKAWEFDTVLDGWSPQNHGSSGSLVITTAIGDPATSVARGTTISSSTDPRTNYLGSLDLPVDATNWHSLEFRLRQLDGVGGAPGSGSQAFDSSGTLVLVTALGITASNYFGALTAPTGAQVARQSFVAEADNWVVFTLDLSNAPTSAATPITSFRIDPIGGSDNLNKGYEFDYIRLYAIPEPGALSVLGLGALALFRRRRA